MSSELIANYSEFQQKTSQQDWDINYLAIGLGGEVGELLNEVKKIKRDDNDVLTEERKNKIEKEMGDILWYFTGISNLLNIPVEKILASNMEKLHNNNNNLDLENKFMASPWG